MSPKHLAIRDRSLSDLEHRPLPDLKGDSYLNSELRRLWSVPLKELRIEDLRLLVGQSFGLPFLVPLALEHLVAHPLASGDFYPGDLL